ncbi:MAG: type II secretion system F family protein [Burkholderiaceae bacterium]
MNEFEYRAVASDGRAFGGRMAALNEADLDARLSRLGLLTVRARAVAQRRSWWIRHERVPARDRLDLFVQLHTLLKAGVPLLEALADIRDSAGGEATRRAVTLIVQRIEIGGTLGDALAEQPAVFDPQLVALVRAAEASGTLTAVLARIVEALKWREELVAKLRKALSYPAFVALVVFGAVAFLMVYLVPQLVQFLRTMGEALPLQTRLLIATSEAFVRYWYLILTVPPAAAAGLVFAARRSAAVRRRVDRALLAVPVLGELLKKLDLARFLGTLALMYRSGIPLIDGLRQAEAALVNRVLRDAVGRAAETIERGAGLAEAFAATGLMPATLLRMLRVGERSGELDAALEHATQYFARDADETIARLQTKIEPTLTLILGLMLAWVMIAVLGPVYETVGRIRA